VGHTSPQRCWSSWHGTAGFCIYLLTILAFQAMRDTRTPFFLYLLENGLNILLAFAFRSTLGAKGLALSLAIAYTVAAIAALAVLRNRIGSLGGFTVGRYVLRTVVCSLVMAFVVALVLAGVGSGRALACSCACSSASRQASSPMRLPQDSPDLCRLANFEAETRDCRKGKSWPG